MKSCLSMDLDVYFFEIMSPLRPLLPLLTFSFSIHIFILTGINLKCDTMTSWVRKDPPKKKTRLEDYGAKPTERKCAIVVMQ